MNYNKKTLLALLFIVPMALTGCFKDPNEKNTENGSGSGSGSGGGGANITSGLLAHYTFDNQTPNDISENFLHASVFNEARFVNSNSHNGTYYLHLSGVQGSYMSIPQNLFTGRRQWTVSFWIKDLSAGKIFSAQEGVNNGYYDAPTLVAKQDGMLMFRHSGGGWGGDYFDPMNYNYINTSTEWHQWVLVVSEAESSSYNSNAKLYVDGVLRTNINTRYDGGTVARCTQIMFGGDGASTCATMRIDDIRIYGRALEQKDVTALYNAER